MGSIRTIVAAAGVTLIVAACAAASSGVADASGGAAGLFTAPQSNRGEAAFNANCAGCHASQELSGRLFRINWEGKPVGELYSFMRSTMPFNVPGSLTDQQYVDITAYMLRLNGYAPGATELPPDLDMLNEIPFQPTD